MQNFDPAGELRAATSDVRRRRTLADLRWRLTLVALVALVAAVVGGGIMGLSNLTIALLAGGIVAVASTRRGTRARTVVQIVAGLASLALGALSVGAFFVSGAILVQGARGADLGFGGVFVFIGIPLGFMLGFGSLSLASLALGGRRGRSRGADGLTYTDPPAMP